MSASALPTRVPLLDLKRAERPLHDEMKAALEKVVESGIYILGPEIQQCEQAISAYCQAKHGIACASGTDALLLAMMALDIGPGDEVILPSFTFFATAGSAARLGATLKFADILPDSYCIDPASVRSLITEKTKAIVPVHLYGQSADMTALTAISQEYNIPIVEDAAQAIGAQWEDKRVCSIGTLGCLSFYPTKNLGTAGDGGMVITNDDALAEKVAMLRVHGMKPRYYHQILGINGRLDAFQGATLNVKLPHLDSWTAMRQNNAKIYGELFAEAGLDKILTLPKQVHPGRHVWNQYVIRVPDGKRDALRAFLTENQIGSDIYYPFGIHKQPCFVNKGLHWDNLPQTDKAGNEVIALPNFPGLTLEEQQAVLGCIEKFFN